MTATLQTGTGYTVGTPASARVFVGDNDYFAGLSKLTLSAGSLEPEFARNTYLYTASVANRVDTLTVTAMPESRTEDLAGVGCHHADRC